MNGHGVWDSFWTGFVSMRHVLREGTIISANVCIPGQEAIGCINTTTNKSINHDEIDLMIIKQSVDSRASAARIKDVPFRRLCSGLLSWRTANRRSEVGLNIVPRRAVNTRRSP